MDYTEEISKILSTELEPYVTIGGEVCIDGVLTSTQKLNEFIQQLLQQTPCSMSVFCEAAEHLLKLKKSMKKYKTIVIDPPWKYGNWAAPTNRINCIGWSKPLPYSSMSIDEIQALPIKELADENCELYLWATQKYLYEAIGILTGWGFKYCTTITWCKKPRGTGQGGVYCPTTEFLLHGRIGKMPKVKRIDSTWFLTTRPHNSHSTKPDFFQELIETVSQEPRLEMFARRERSGWDVFGNEVENSIRLPINEQMCGKGQNIA